MNNNDITCPKCGFTDHIVDSHYCQNCGIELLNFCTNEHCEINELPSPEYQSIPHNAKYCPYCGSKSTYYDYLNKNED